MEIGGEVFEVIVISDDIAEELMVTDVAINFWHPQIGWRQVPVRRDTSVYALQSLILKWFQLSPRTHQVALLVSGTTFDDFSDVPFAYAAPHSEVQIDVGPLTDPRIFDEFRRRRH